MNARLQQLFSHLLVGHDVFRLAVPIVFATNSVERRLSGVNEISLDKRWHLTVEKREQKRSDMRTVDVGVRHDDDLIVTALGNVDFAAVAHADRRDHTLNLFVLENANVMRFVRVDDLAAQRKNRLKFSKTPAFRRAAR